MPSTSRNAPILSLLLSAAPCIVHSPASAAENGLYVGASLGESTASHDWQFDPRDVVEDDTDSSYKLIGGFRPVDPLAIELSYVDHGAGNASVQLVCIAIVGPCPPLRLAADARSLSVAAVGLYSFRIVEIFGKLGIARWEVEHASGLATGARQIRKARGTDPTYGVGAQVRLGGIALRLEYESFDFGRGESDLVSVGFTYAF